jgi:hypothetical protein
LGSYERRNDPLGFIKGGVLFWVAEEGLCSIKLVESSSSWFFSWTTCSLHIHRLYFHVFSCIALRKLLIPTEWRSKRSISGLPTSALIL